QGRLLLLLHAQQCSDDGCVLLAKCGAAKTLLQHLASCLDDGCSVPQCASSRALLEHHGACVNSACALCAPAR
ncbi:hypothetical protein JKP88DRAFT_154052, partial [Tribonema minus]